MNICQPNLYIYMVTSVCVSISFFSDLFFFKAKVHLILLILCVNRSYFFSDRFAEWAHIFMQCSQEWWQRKRNNIFRNAFFFVEDEKKSRKIRMANYSFVKRFLVSSIKTKFTQKKTNRTHKHRSIAFLYCLYIYVRDTKSIATCCALAWLWLFCQKWIENLFSKITQCQRRKISELPVFANSIAKRCVKCVRNQQCESTN